MPPVRAARATASIVDNFSDTDDDMLAGPAPMPPEAAKKRPGRPKATNKKGAEDATAKSHARSNTTAPKKTAPGRKRKNEVPETMAPEDSDDADDLGLPSGAASSKLDRPEERPKAITKSGRERSKHYAAVDVSDDQMDTEGEVQASSNLSRTPATKRAPRPVKRVEIPETQMEPIGMEELDATMDGSNQHAAHEQDVKTTSDTRKRTKMTKQNTSKRRACTTSEAEREADSETNQRLSDMTKRFDALQVQFHELQEVGVEEAQKNYDQLKKSSESRRKVADELIAKLRVDAANATTKDEEISKLQAETKSLRDVKTTTSSENKRLQESLQAAQGEVKALHAKLAATRAASEQGKSVPGSAVKGPGGRQAAVASAEAQKDIAKRALKEDLYADLSGLIIRDVKRRDEQGEDVYDCIQTGRNGTLQFHLSIPNPPPEGEAYDDVEIGYEPILDESRDRQVIGLLPEFAREEICFQRGQAAKFYAQIRESMQKRIEYRAEDEDMHDDA